MRLRRADIRRTHPLLYFLSMSVAVFMVLMGLNLWWFHPTFDPYGIDKTVVGTTFFVLGIAQLVALNLLRVRIVTQIVRALSMGFTLLWAVGNTQQVFAGKASWAQPITLLFAAVVQARLLVEPPMSRGTGGMT